MNKPKVEALLDILTEINPEVADDAELKPEGWKGKMMSGYIFLCVDNIDLRREIVEKHMDTTTYIAIGTEGAEIAAAYVKNADGTLGAPLVQADQASAGKFAYDPATKAMTFSGVETGSEVIVYYKRHIQANILENKSDKYSGKATLYIDAVGEDKCSNVYRIQIRIPKADFSGEFSLELGDSQTMHNFEAEALASACGGSGILWDYTVFGSNAADATE